jgi:hypothetical protein
MTSGDGNDVMELEEGPPEKARQFAHVEGREAGEEDSQVSQQGS